MKRRVVVVPFILVGLALLAAASWFCWGRQTGPAPPLVDLKEEDPAVVQEIQAGQNAVRQAPRSAAAWGRLGLIFMAQDFQAEAETCFAQAEHLDPKDARWPYLQGGILSLGNPDAAIPKFRRAVELSGDAVDTPRLRLAETLLGQGRLDEVEPALRSLLQQNPSHPRAHLDLGRLAYERGDLEASLGHLDQACDSPFTRKGAHSLKAEIFQGRGDLPAALRELALANHWPEDALWPDSFLDQLEPFEVGKRARLKRATLLLSQGRVTEALPILQETVQAYPEADLAWQWLGRGRLQQKDFAGAEQALRKAVELAPERAESQFYLGVVLFEQGDAKNAAPYFRKATDLSPTNVMAHYNLAHCLMRLGDRAGAKKAFQAALGYAPFFPEAHTNLGDLLAQEGQNTEALSHLRQALQLDPTDQRASHLVEQIQTKGPKPQ